MANDMNITLLIGRLTRDSELRYTKSGTAVGRFSLAVNRYTGKDKGEEVSFFEIVVWGKLAESLNPYLTKGKQVSVAGELHQNRWEQDGQARSKFEIVASSVQLLGSTQNTQATTTQSSQNQTYPQSSPTTPAYTSQEPVQPTLLGPEQFDDDIPF